MFTNVSVRHCLCHSRFICVRYFFFGCHLIHSRYWNYVNARNTQPTKYQKEEPSIRPSIIHNLAQICIHANMHWFRFGGHNYSSAHSFSISNRFCEKWKETNETKKKIELQFTINVKQFLQLKSNLVKRSSMWLIRFIDERSSCAHTKYTFNNNGPLSVRNTLPTLFIFCLFYFEYFDFG